MDNSYVYASGMITSVHMEDRTRSTLLMRLKDRTDTDAWETFASLYRPLIVSYAMSRELSLADAEDVAQQCTQAVLEKIEDYEHLSSFKAWLRAIANHKIIDQFRRSRRQVQGRHRVLEHAAGNIKDWVRRT